MRPAIAVVMPARNARLGAGQRVVVAAEIAVTYCAARWWLFRLTFPEAVAAARNVPGKAGAGLPEDEQRSAAIRLGRAVERTLRPLPVDSRCLVTALVLTRMLARRGIENSFVLGVRSKPAFAAHAWVEQRGVALLPTSSDFHRLSEL
jgi:hypothetical protein